jgi:hypothetical protein
MSARIRIRVCRTLSGSEARACGDQVRYSSMNEQRQELEDKLAVASRRSRKIGAHQLAATLRSDRQITGPRVHHGRASLFWIRTRAQGEMIAEHSYSNSVLSCLRISCWRVCSSGSAWQSTTPRRGMTCLHVPHRQKFHRSRPKDPTWLPGDVTRRPRRLSRTSSAHHDTRYPTSSTDT